MKKLLATTAVALALAGSGATAATMNGEFWDAPGGTVANVTDGITQAGLIGAATATWTVTDINYGDPDDPTRAWDIEDLQGFLSGDNVNDPLGDALSIVGNGLTDFQESVIRISGLVRFAAGDVVTVTSDDGFRLLLDGVAAAPNPTTGCSNSTIEGIRPPGCTNTITGIAPGSYFAELWYIEGNETQAQLQSNLADYATVVPLPAGAVLMLTAMGGLGLMRARRKS